MIIRAVARLTAAGSDIFGFYPPDLAVFYGALKNSFARYPKRIIIISLKAIEIRV